MNIVVIGLNHKTAPVDVREKLAFTPATLRSALTHFGNSHVEGRITDVQEGVILATCNRLEIYAMVNDPTRAANAITTFLSQSRDIAIHDFAPYLYVYHNEQAVEHLLRVSCGLDSLVLGEPQILGQVTQAYEAALAQQSARTVLSKLFTAAIHTGKRARTETGIGLNPSSVSSVAARLAQSLLGEVSEQRVLLIGAGEMGAIAVRSLIKRGVSNITVANRTIETAQQLAEEWHGRAVNFQTLPQELGRADIVITSTSAPHPILNQDMLAPLLAERHNRPLFIIDIAVPRDVDPNVTRLEGVHLYNIDDLQLQVEENVKERRAEIPHVTEIVNEECVKFQTWFDSLGAVSVITNLRRQSEAYRQGELERLFNRLELDERERELVATMSHRLVNKILHRPTLQLKKEAAAGNGVAYFAAVNHLFVLDNVDTGR